MGGKTRCGFALCRRWDAVLSALVVFSKLSGREGFKLIRVAILE